jgi:hypothetical protein
MKRIIVIIVVAIHLVGCTPTNIALSTAITLIQAVTPTIPFSLVNITNPLQTEKQLPPLKYCLLYPSEISSIADTYSIIPTTVKGEPVDDSIDQIQVVYPSDGGEDTALYFWIVQFIDIGTAADNFGYVKDNLYSSTSYMIPGSVDLPSDSVAYLQADGSIVLAYRIHDIVVLTGMMRLPDVDEYDQIVTIAMNAEKQKDRLQECGYIPQYQQLIFQFSH